MPPRTAPALDPIAATILAWLADTLRAGRADGIGPATSLVASGLLDSASVVELVLFLEQRFGIRIEDREVGLDNFDTLGALAEFVRRKLRREC